MSTAQDVIVQSLRLLNVLADGETMTASEASDCMLRLNDMLDSWSVESLDTFVTLQQSFNLVVGQNTYTIGPTGTWAGTRPLTINATPFVRDSRGYDYPLTIIDDSEWDRIGDKTTATSDIPDVINYQPNYPNGTIHVWPIPIVNYAVFLDCKAPLADLAALNTQVVFPPGYQRAITYNLAIELQGMFSERPIPDAVIKIAKDSLAVIRRNNQISMNARFDSALRSSKRLYNIYRDNSG